MSSQFKLNSNLNFKISYLVCLLSYLTLSAQKDFTGLKHWEIPSKNPDRIIV